MGNSGFLFGARKIPPFLKGLGQGIRNFSDEKNKEKKELSDPDEKL